MASSYEKAACGVDPNYGWGEPRPIDRFWEAFVLALGLLVYWPMISALIELVRSILT